MDYFKCEIKKNVFPRKNCLKNCAKIIPLKYIYLGLYLVIVAGALLAIIGFFGCYGALRENKCLLSLVSKHKFFAKKWFKNKVAKKFAFSFL